MRKRGAALLLVIFSLSLTLTACWIPLPQETAIVVQVMKGADPKGIPVDGVRVIVDGDTLVTGDRSTGQVFKSLSVGGSHKVQVDSASLTDPQGGREWVIRGSHISGESPEGTYLAYADRGFALGDTAMPVPVADGFITVVTVYLDELQVSPVDNQWLTAGRDTSSPYRSGNIDEFASTILPTFRWRQEPSLVGTVSFTFQLWQDTDGDTRFPLGIRNASGYDNTLPGIQPDWEVPLAGLQGARTAGTGQVVLWSSRTDGYPADAYDLYYAPTLSWTSDWEKNMVVRDVQWTPSGGALFFTVGPGAPSPNDTLLLKNGTGYTFGLRAMDGTANLDAIAATSTRNVTPVPGGTALGSASITQPIATGVGGALSFTLDNSLGSGPIFHHVYAAPSATETYDPRYIRKDVSYTGSPVPVTLTGLVNGTNYYIGVEPFAANGDVGVAGSTIMSAPSAPISDTVAPSWSSTSFTVSPTAMPGQALASWGAATDSSSITYRLYHAPGSVASSDAGGYASGTYAFMDTTGTSATVGDLVNDVQYGFAVIAMDSAGNGSSRLTTTVTLPGSGGPVWDTESPAIFSSVRWASGSTPGSTVYPLGWTYSYDGFPLGQDPAATPPDGEYVWRVIQTNGNPAAQVDGKLGAFYTYNGYYYSSTESGALDMSGSGPSSNVDHRRVFSFMEAGIPPLNLASDIMGSPLDGSFANPNDRYQQRPASEFAGLLDSGTAPVPPDPDWVNQMVIQYQTDADGEAVFSKTNSGDFLGFLNISVMNRTTNLALEPPYLRKKEFLETYNHTNGDLVDFPSAIYPLLFSGDLADPDYRDPELAP